MDVEISYVAIGFMMKKVTFRVLIYIRKYINISIGRWSFMGLILIIVGIAVFWLMHSKLKYDLKISTIAALGTGVIAPYILFFVLNNISLVFTIIIIGVGGLYVYSRSTEGAMIREWKAKVPRQMTANEFSDLIAGVIGNQEEMPYYRMQAFSSNIENIDTDNDFPISFNAHPSDDEMLFREFGYLITTRGIIYKRPVLNHKTDNENKYNIDTVIAPFQDVYKVTSDEDKIVFYYANQSKKKISGLKGDSDRINKIFSVAIDSGWTKMSGKIVDSGISGDKIMEDLNIAEQHASRAAERMNLNVTKGSGLGTLDRSVRSDLGQNQINDRFGGGQGHGHVGEQYGDTLDRLRFKRTSHNGMDHKPLGKDRMVNGVDIQTKYCASAGKSIGQVFDKNGAKYISKDGPNAGKMMTLEVPRDQYQDCVKLMEKKIEQGQVPGESDPKNAPKYVKKGAISYFHSEVATKSIFDRNSEIRVKDSNGKLVRDSNGNPKVQKVTLGEKLVWSAGGDFATGVASAMPTAFITGIWVYLNCIWDGENSEDALKQSSLAMLKPALWGGTIYMFSSQFAGSKPGQKLANQLFKGVNNKGKLTKNMTGLTMTALTVAFTIGPDAINCLRGRISVNQLVKNSVVTGVGVAAGYAFAGPVGGMVGGAATSFATKKILDQFIEDDAVGMIRVAKEEFIETVLSAGLKQDEIEEILNQTFLEKHFNKQLQIMFSKEDSRGYIHNVYFEDVVAIFKKREIPEENQLLAVVS